MQSSQPDAGLRPDLVARDRPPVQPPAPPGAGGGAHRPSRTSLPMALLAAGVPLSLLIDLMSPNGPDSRLIAASEQAAGS
jgi:hypothetical protein